MTDRIARLLPPAEMPPAEMPPVAPVTGGGDCPSGWAVVIDEYGGTDGGWSLSGLLRLDEVAAITGQGIRAYQPAASPGESA